MRRASRWGVVFGLTVIAVVKPTVAAAEPASRVAAGGYHTCAVTDGGGVRCWGENRYGQLGDNTTTWQPAPAPVTDLDSGVVAVAAGLFHTCALTSAGALWCWGLNNSGQLGNGSTASYSVPVAVSGLGSGVAAVAAGFYHTCAVTSAGALWCWGQNSLGELGDGTTTNRSTPVAVSGLGSGVIAVAGGGSHTCAATGAGAVWCWGINSAGQLGDGTQTSRLTPVAVSGLSTGVAAVSAGSNHSCAVTGAGALWCWGDNSYGQLGDGSNDMRMTPVAVLGLGSGVAAVTDGFYHTCAVTTAGAVSCWGHNLFGSLGDGSTTNRSTPATVDGLGTGAAAATAGAFHTCALIGTGAVRCWGLNRSGQVGDGLPIDLLAPTGVGGLGGVVTVAAGESHACARTGAGAAWCWGGNGYGELGDGTTTMRAVPAPVTGLGSGVTAVAAGSRHSCALTAAGALFCWGNNYYGQLGDGTSTDRLAPTAVSGLASGVVAVATGFYHACAATTAGAAWCWGGNYSGELGDGTTTTRFAPVAVSGLSGVAAVAAGGNHSCAVTTAGAVWCWGYNYYGQLGNGTTTDSLTPVAVSGLGSGVVSVTAGGNHTCALTTAGAVWCWGANWYGQLGDGTGNSSSVPVALSSLGSGVAQVSAGGYHTCAVTGAGAAVCWGWNSCGQIGDGTRTLRYAPVTVAGFGTDAAGIGGGEEFSCGVTSAGGVRCWGHNDFGQLGDGRPLVRLTPRPTVGLQPSAADVGRDGRSDVVWQHATGGALWVWPMNGPVPLSQTYLGTVADTGWRIRGLGDQTGDGKADLLWRHDTSGALFLWAMNGTAVVAQTYLGAVVPDYAIVGTADYTGEGKTDVLWRHQTTGDLWLWRMNGASIEAVTWVATIAPAFAVVASGDLNGDGKADLLWRHQTSGDVWVWPMNGAVPMSQVHLGAVADLGYHVAGLADHDRDGRADVVWHHQTSGDVWMWRMEGATIAGIAHIATLGDANYRVAGVGDYDGNGRADVLWHHATSGDMWMWSMDGFTIASANWVAAVTDIGYQVVNPK